MRRGTLCVLSLAALLATSCTQGVTANKYEITIDHFGIPASAVAADASKHCAQYGKKAVFAEKVGSTTSRFECVAGS